MKTILENYLDILEVRYTKQFTRNLFLEHPHKHNMYGLKTMLDVYGIKSLGVCVDSKNLSELNYPCILHTSEDFVIGLQLDTHTITFLLHNKKTTVSHDAFKRMWTGNALVIEETTDAIEPDYKEHRRNEIVSMTKDSLVPGLLILASLIGIATHITETNIWSITRLVLSFIGVLVCSLLMEKQLFGKSLYGDRVCSIFHHSNCNSILDGTKAKIFGMSWSEIGLGYFIANTLLLSLFPASSLIVAAINGVAMLFGVWSVYYQWRIAKNWCMLCVIVQLVVWMMGVTSVGSCLTSHFYFELSHSLLYCVTFAISILIIHVFASAHVAEKERVLTIQQYRSLKANQVVAKALLENSEYYETTLDDSSIIFGNPKAKMRVTILTNPHCNPCARMHHKVEMLLKMSTDICIQYIFVSFNEALEDSSRYLIYCYFEKENALNLFSLWYTKDKFDSASVIQKNEGRIHTDKIEKEMERHRLWLQKTPFSTTPTILVNGYKLPKEYELEDLVLIANVDITKKNMTHHINGRSTTPLGAELQTAEETV